MRCISSYTKSNCTLYNRIEKFYSGTRYWENGHIRYNDVILCLMPQNAWTSAEAPLSWGIYRNIPFTILGAVIVILFYRSVRTEKEKPFRFLWLAVVISFACYIPVVLFADMVPPVGMLMIPKTCAYVWVVLIGYKAMKGSNGK